MLHLNNDAAGLTASRREKDYNATLRHAMNMEREKHIAEGQIFFNGSFIIMRNQIQQFHNDEFGSSEIMMIDEKPYFPATECAKILGYTNAPEAIRRHFVEDGSVKRAVIDRLGRKQEMKCISEGNA